MSENVINKQKWVSLFREIGLSDEQMNLWHQKFEAQYPNEHQSFLEWLSISSEEIQKVRALEDYKQER